MCTWLFYRKLRSANSNDHLNVLPSSYGPITWSMFVNASTQSSLLTESGHVVIAMGIA